MTGAPTGPRRITACPQCGRPSVEDSRPFCSERCRLVDLNRWLSGAYAIPAVETDEDAAANDNDREPG